MNEPLWDTPPGWRWTTVGDVAETSLGKMLNKAVRTGPNQVPYLRNENVKWGRFDLSDIRTLHVDEDALERYRLREGDVLVCEGGAIGRSAVWHGSKEPMYYQKALHRVRTTGDVLPQYFRYWMERLASFDLLLPYATGSTILHLPQAALRKVQIAVPPIDEQREVVATIEMLISRLDVASDGLSDVLHRSRSMYRATVDRETSTGPLRRLAEVANTSSGGTPKSTVDAYYGGGIPWAVIGDLDDDVVRTTERTITPAGLDASSAKWADEGALLVAMYGSVGKLGIAGVPLTTNQAIAAIVPDPDVLDARFLFYRLLADRPALIRAGKGGTQTNISQTILRDWHVPVPPLDVQKAAVDRLDRIDTLLGAVTSKVEGSVQSVSPLRRSLLKAAFFGRLTMSARVPRSVGDAPQLTEEVA